MVLFTEALNARMVTLVMNTDDKAVVYYLFVSLHVIMTVVNIVLSYYFWRCGLFYYLSISGFYDGEEVKRSSSQLSDASQPIAEETRSLSMTSRSRTSSWSDMETETLSESGTRSRSLVSRASRISYRSNLLSRTASSSQSRSRTTDYHTETETVRQYS